MLSEKQLAELVGRKLPGGEYTIEPYVNWLVNDIVEAPAGAVTDAVVAHPLFAYIASARGKGLAWDDVFEICGATAADGPMFGEHRSELLRPLVPGETVSVSAEFTTAVRKSGRKTGVFDVIGFEMTLTGSDGDVAARTYSSVVYPRRAA
jgi:hypothetical protein